MFKNGFLLGCLITTFIMGGWECNAQLDSIHYIPPLHTRREPGPQYIYLSTPSIIPITIGISTGGGNAIVDCDGVNISSVLISNAQPAVICVGFDYGTALLVDISLLNKNLTNHGIVLTSSGLFYANLRIFTNNLAQAGSLTSKGKWAKGKHFRIGHLFSNNDPGGNKCHIFSVMATQDGTSVQLSDVLPGVRFAGVNPSSNFTLNKGECRVMSIYLDAFSPLNDNGLMGALITSDRPIIVNCGSWDGSPNGSQRDMGIDQITPMKYTGKDYILVRGVGPTSLETPIVIADSDNTSVFVNGSAIPDYNLNAGQWVRIPTSVYSPQNNMYIRASKKIAVYQIIGVANDPKTPGLNFIPALSCLGDSVVDNIVDIDKIGDRTYVGGMFIVAHFGAWVEINDRPINVFPDPVTGNSDFVTYRVLQGLSGNIKVSSSDNIQVGMYGFAAPSAFAGYFSGFKNFNIEVIANGSSCVDSIMADLTNIQYFDWYRNDSLLPDEQDRVLHVKKPGWYHLIGYQCYVGSDTSEKIWIGRPDTVYLDSSSCTPPPGKIKIKRGVNWTGCDSLTIIKYKVLPKDSTTLDKITTCDIAQSGFISHRLTNQFGCDSIVLQFVQWIPPDTTRLSDRSCFPSDTGIFYYNYTNIYGCDSVVQYDISLSRTDTTILNYFVCDEMDVRTEEYVLTNNVNCDSLIREVYKLAPSYNFTRQIEACDGGEIQIQTHLFYRDTLFVQKWTTSKGCDSIHQYKITFHTNYTLNRYDSICQGDSTYFEGSYYAQSGIFKNEYQTFYGCDSISTLHLTVFSLPQVRFDSISKYCYGDEILVSLTDSFIHYWWSDGSELCCLMTDSAGLFAVRVEDVNGCQQSASIAVPPPIQLQALFDKQDVLCYGFKTGSINMAYLKGGDGPYQYFVDGKLVDSWPLDSLLPGIYPIEIMDANGCVWMDTIQIDQPLAPFQVSLPADTTVRYGDVIEVDVEVVYGLYDGINWYVNDQLESQDQLRLLLYPKERTHIRIEATDVNGCVSMHEMNIVVLIDPQLYVPNVFTPNGDGINDYFSVFPNDHIQEIRLLEVYSRWGEKIFHAENQLPNSSLLRWSGVWNNQVLNSGVFTYFVVAESIDGRTIEQYGSITLIR